MPRLNEAATQPSVVLEQVKRRADWQRHQEAQKKREEEELERERVSYAQIDWHDFVVVETVDYQPFEMGNFPVTFVCYNSGPQPPPTAPSHDNVIVRKDYNPKVAPKPQARPPAPDEYLISPITGERIPASQVAEHMRIGLLDPRWLEQRDRQMQEKMTQESVYAPGSAIENSLR